MNTPWLKGYYLATPLFWLIDDLFGVSIRVSALDGYPWLKAAYYLFCIGCTYMIFRTKWSSLVGLLESSINIIMLFVGFCLPYFRVIASMDTDHPLEMPSTTMHLVNFMLSGTFAIIAFHRLSAHGLGHRV